MCSPARRPTRVRSSRGDVVEVESLGHAVLRNTVEEWDADLDGPGEQPAVTGNTLHVALAIPEDEAERRAASA